MSDEAIADENLGSVSSGIPNLDRILSGGLIADRVYLIEGTPGSGKTTLALQFLIEGRRKDERGLYVTLSETKDELVASAESHGLSLEGIDIFELIPNRQELDPDNQFTMFQPSEVEMSVTTRMILAEIERVNPSRLVLDSLSEMRLLAQSTLRFRRQILALKQYFIGKKCTVLLLDDMTTETADLQLQSIAHAVISLEQLSPEYGAERRRLRVVKFRGKKYQGGYHDFTIVKGGLSVFPRLVAADHLGRVRSGRLQTGIEGLDKLMGGGVEWGTSVLLLGPSGIGKSSLALQYARASAASGDRAAIFTFDESKATLLKRMAGLGMPMDEYLESGRISIQAIDPAELSPGEFADAVRQAVESEDGRQGANLLVIDSLNGYLNAMPEERFLSIQLHELLTYLSHQGVVTFLIVAQHGVLGSGMATPIDTTYLSDAVILFRYFESQGAVRQAISVVKKRTGTHERTIRELTMDHDGIHLGNPLQEFQGVLTGTPSIVSLKDSMAKES